MQNYVGLNNLVLHPKTVSLVFVIRKSGYTNLVWGGYWDSILDYDFFVVFHKNVFSQETNTIGTLVSLY